MHRRCGRPCRIRGARGQGRLRLGPILGNLRRSGRSALEAPEARHFGLLGTALGLKAYRCRKGKEFEAKEDDRRGPVLCSDRESGVNQDRAGQHGEKYIAPTTLHVRGTRPRERRSDESYLLDGLSAPEGSPDLPPILSAQLLKSFAPFFLPGRLVPAT